MALSRSAADDLEICDSVRRCTRRYPTEPGTPTSSLAVGDWASDSAPPVASCCVLKISVFRADATPAEALVSSEDGAALTAESSLAACASFCAVSASWLLTLLRAALD